MTNKGNTYLVDFIAGKQAKENPTILRIFINAAYTQIDFGYVAPWKYVRGGWIKIAPYSFLKVKGDNKKYNLLEIWGGDAAGTASGSAAAAAANTAAAAAAAAAMRK